MEDVDTAAGAAGVKDDGVGASGFLVGGHFAVDESVVSGRLVGGAGRHDVKDEHNEKKWDRYNKQSPSEPVDLVGE